ncbi:MAG: GFA family protein [Hyphomicrobiales bacterium]|nr:GFA family protein [Hyphomicrobiales bacterium]
MCQKAMGGIGGAFVACKDVVWTGARPKRYRSSNKVERGFCASCGTPLTFETATAVDIAIAAFDRAGEIVPIMQFDRAHRLPWADGLSTLPEPDEAESRRIIAWQSDIVSHQHPDGERP